MTKKVIVASKNPVKINAVKIGFERMFPLEKFEFEGISVSSEVSEQPMDDEETLTGGINRAHNAKAEFQDADYWVGIEGGVEKINNEMNTFAWVVIESKYKKGKARTGAFFLPRKIIELVAAGKELGEADDIVFQHTNSKQKNGSVGILTENVITRTSYYTETVILALIPFKNIELY
ncbi:MAG TPA: non-canonical purine NTP phosphatase [Ignavibacteria bacterium]|nr:non-canonical purine NTP phosphatase [Ignavibacteria bacterium]